MALTAQFTNVNGDMAPFAFYTVGSSDEILRVNIALEYDPRGSANIQLYYTDEKGNWSTNQNDQPAIQTITIKAKAGTQISIGTITFSPDSTPENYSIYIVLDVLATL